MPILTTNAAPGASPPRDHHHQELAALLRSSLREIGKGAGSRLPAWARDLRRCEAVECCGDAARLARTLRWFCANVKRKDLPPAWSAGGFRKWFHQIEAKMERAERNTPLAEVSPEAAKAAERAALIGVAHPAFRALMPTFAQATIDRYAPLADRVHAYVKRRTTELAAEKITTSNQTATLRACACVAGACLPPPETFAQQYLEDVLRQMHGWKDFRGDFGYFAFDPAASNGYFERRLCRALGGYGGAEAWRLWEGVKGVMGL